jgi:hypothetical protein
MLALALSPLVRVVGVAPVMGQHQPLLIGEKLEARSANLPNQQNTDLDTKAAVLLALQDGSISGTTLLVEEELPKDKPPAPPAPSPAPFVPPGRRHGRR